MNNTSRWVLPSLAAFVLVTSALPPCGAQTSSIALQKSFDGRSLPGFQNGRFVARDNVETPNSPEVYLFAPDGSVALKVAVPLAGARNTEIAAVAPAAQGGLVVSVGGVGADGQKAFYLKWIDGHGRIARSVETSPFAPVALYVHSNGEVWVAGREFETAAKLSKNHNVLRRYDAHAKLVESMLAWSSFPQREKGHPDADAYLFGDSERVCFLSVTAMEIASFHLATAKMERQSLPAPVAGGWITGAALVDGRLVVSAQAHGETGLYLWETGRAGWAPLPLPQDSARQSSVGLLLGSDATGLWLSDGPGRVWHHDVR